MNAVQSGLSPEEPRRLVADDVGTGKSNRAIAQELQIDERAVRRDRKYLATPGQERSIPLGSRPCCRVRILTEHV